MIFFRDVTKEYNGKTVLNNLSLKIAQGECVVLKGSSGSGKTTLLWLMSAMAKPSSGEIVVDGENIARLPDHFASRFRQEKIGFIFQQYHLFEGMSVAKNILLPLIPSKISNETLQKKLQEQLKRYSIEELQNKDVSKLSGGQQQRVAIARAMINDPKIILADEPTANLDRKLSSDFVQHMQHLNSQGVTIVIATHDPFIYEAKWIDRVIEIEEGRVL